MGTIDDGGIAYNQDMFRSNVVSDPSSSSWGSGSGTGTGSNLSRRSSSIGTSLGGGSFDLGGAFFEGLGGSLLPPSSRKHSLSMPPHTLPHSLSNSLSHTLPHSMSHTLSNSQSLPHPPAQGQGLGTARSGFIIGMGTGGDVDLSAYQNMAASLQAQGNGHVSTVKA